MLEKLDALVGSIYYVVFMIMLLIVPFIIDIQEESKTYVLAIPFVLFFFKVIIQAIAIKKRS